MIRQFAYGLFTYLPYANRLRMKGTGGTVSARYCYSVWLRHLVLTYRNSSRCYPKVVAELGPGDSLGIGLAALISGSDKYFALDVVRHADIKRNESIFDELVNLFKEREPIPGNEEFPRVKPLVDCYDFPHDLLDDLHLEKALDGVRLDKIRNSISHANDSDSMLEYIVPWDSEEIRKEINADMIYTQAVLEHVDNLKYTYAVMYDLLKQTGCMSHQIDLKSHGTAKEWNGHWRYSDLLWKIIKGRRPYLLNRIPYSHHVSYMRNAGFNILYEQKTLSDTIYKVSDLAHNFHTNTEEDLTVSSVYIQAIK